MFSENPVKTALSSKLCLVLKENSFQTILYFVREFSPNNNSYSENSVQIQWTVYIQWVVLNQSYRKDVLYLLAI